MQINADLQQRVVLDSNTQAWQPSTRLGVECWTLELRSSDTRVTWQCNTCGEELLVLEGALQFDYAAYLSGTWACGAHGALQQSFSAVGCLL